MKSTIYTFTLVALLFSCSNEKTHDSADGNTTPSDSSSYSTTTDSSSTSSSDTLTRSEKNRQFEEKFEGNEHIEGK